MGKKMIVSILGSIAAAIAIGVILARMFFNELRRYYEEESSVKKWKS